MCAHSIDVSSSRCPCPCSPDCLSCVLQVVASEEAALLEQLRSALHSTSDTSHLQAVAIMGNLPTGASPDLYAKVCV
jgi:hypothetical protein